MAITEAGPGSAILYREASALERAMADVEVLAMQQVPARLITDNIDPAKVQSGNALQFLAYELGVTIWEAAWTEDTKRLWMAQQWLFKQRVGLPGGLLMALAINGFDLVDMRRPNGGMFLGVEGPLPTVNAPDGLDPATVNRLLHDSETYLDVDPFDVPIKCTTVLIWTHTHGHLDEMSFDDGYYDVDFMCPEDQADTERAERAVVGSSKTSDTVLVDFEALRPLTFGDVWTDETLPTDWRPNRL